MYYRSTKTYSIKYGSGQCNIWTIVPAENSSFVNALDTMTLGEWAAARGTPLGIIVQVRNAAARTQLNNPEYPRYVAGSWKDWVDSLNTPVSVWSVKYELPGWDRPPFRNVVPAPSRTTWFAKWSNILWRTFGKSDDALPDGGSPFRDPIELRELSDQIIEKQTEAIGMMKLQLP